MTKEECIQTVMQASKLSRADAVDAINSISKERERLRAAGQLADIDKKLAEFAQSKADAIKLNAALSRKHAALNITLRPKLEMQIDAVAAAKKGSLVEGFRSILDGSYVDAEGARDSAGARRIAIQSLWLDGLAKDLATIGDEVLPLLSRDKSFVDAVAKEMAEIRPNGRPGVTGNVKAQQAASVFSKYAEVSRMRLNEAGAFIGKLDGWIPQSHDASKLLKAGKEVWLKKIKGGLDMERTFEGLAPDEIDRILSDIYETIATGRDHTVTAQQKGIKIGPANMARSMGKHRELHFVDAEAALRYQDEFGTGNFLQAYLAHLDRASRKLALMEKLGPNPEVMLGSLIEAKKKAIRESSTLSTEQKAKLIESISGSLSRRDGPIGRAYASVVGEILIPEHVGMAKIGAGVRAIQSMAKLGGAVLSSVNDLMTYSMNARYNGVNLFSAYTSAFKAAFAGKSAKQKREIAGSLGVLLDGTLQDIAMRWNAQDTLSGRMASAMNTFFRFSGLEYWTNALKSGYSRMLSNHLAEKMLMEGWDDLPVGLKASLKSAGFADEYAAVIFGLIDTADDGRNYVLPERARNLDDATIDIVIEDEIAALQKAARKNVEKYNEGLDRLRAKARKDIETKAALFFTDQTRYAIIEPDDRTKTAMLWGTRPGTLLGEIVRFVAQFKSFPIAHYQRNLSKSGRFNLPGKRFDLVGVSNLVAGSLILGYAAQVAKDFSKGREPKSPEKLETWLAAMAQSGGAGIYGDFLFAKYNRFGGSTVDSLAGPTLGTVSEVVKMASGTLRGEFDVADSLHLAINNTPFVNLWYTRAALDYAILFHIREMISQGTLRRMERRIKEDYNQEYIVPPSTVVKTGGGFK